PQPAATIAPSFQLQLPPACSNYCPQPPARSPQQRQHQAIYRSHFTKPEAKKRAQGLTLMLSTLSRKKKDLAFCLL
ncbi:hypothetical protein, partial [Erwinia sp. S59]|uniref:hypothetical protein n=1 Tax=Erwinia sp. S59 TaxID=2769340 RepID=UPI0025740A8C